MPRNRAGPRVVTTIPLCEPHLDGSEWAYVKQCLDSGWVSSAGPFVERFEQAIAARLGARHAVAVSSGTAALHLSLLAAGVEPEDEVLVPALTFIAPANAIRYVGAWPVFIDVDPDYWQIDASSAAGFLERECTHDGGEVRNRTTGRRVRAILPVDLLGHPYDADRVNGVARRHRLLVVEDATESLGAAYNGRPVGTLGDVACLSFNGNKIITAGAGGVIVTDNDAYAARARYLSTQAKDDSIEHVHEEVGYNYRLSALQAALACAQLDRLDNRVAAKRAIAFRYAERLSGVSGLLTMRQAPWASSSFWMYTVLLDEAFGRSREDVGRRLAAEGIETRPLWQPLHRSPAHADAVHTPCPVADRVQALGLSLPCSPSLSAEDQDRVIDALRSLAC